MISIHQIAKKKFNTFEIYPSYGRQLISNVDSNTNNIICFQFLSSPLFSGVFLGRRSTFFLGVRVKIYPFSIFFYWLKNRWGPKKQYAVQIKKNVLSKFGRGVKHLFGEGGQNKKTTTKMAYFCFISLFIVLNFLGGVGGVTFCVPPVTNTHKL